MQLTHNHTHTFDGAIGVDFGKVIMGCVDPDGRADTVFLQGSEARAMATPASEGAFETLATLAELFDHRIYIVSKCGPRIEARTRAWLHHHDVFRLTGVDESHLHFCRKRHQKVIYARQFSLTHFIDDRPDVLVHMRDEVRHLLLFGHQKDNPPRWATPVTDWAAVQTWFGLSRA